MNQQEGWEAREVPGLKADYREEYVSGHKYRRTARAKAALLNRATGKGRRFYAEESLRGPYPWRVVEHRVRVR